MFIGSDYLDDHIHGDRFAQEFGSDWNDRKYSGSAVRYPIVMMKTDYMSEVIYHSKLPVAITHNSDYNIDASRFTEFSESITSKWFGQNALFDDQKLIPIPIGLERPGIAGSGNVDDLKWAAIYNFNKLDRLYVNISPGTNPAERIEMLYYLESMPWVTTQKQRLPFRSFLAEVRDHTFIWCPPGNGSDCHRTWEALYMGSIPVCKNNVHNRFFAGILPIILYDNKEQVTYDFLMTEKRRIARKLERNEYTLHALRFGWWKDLILKHAEWIK